MSKKYVKSARLRDVKMKLLAATREGAFTFDELYEFVKDDCTYHEAKAQLARLVNTDIVWSRYAKTGEKVQLYEAGARVVARMRERDAAQPDRRARPHVPATRSARRIA